MENYFSANYPSVDNFKYLGLNFASEIIKYNSFWKNVFNATDYFTIGWFIEAGLHE